MDPIAQNSVVLLAWLDSTVGHDVMMTAIAKGERVAPETALAQLFPDGLAGAARVLPWLAPASRPNLPMCAYAAIAQEGGRVRSGFVVDPEPGDIARLGSEFRSVAHEVGAAATTFFDSIARRRDVPDDIEINILAGTAFRGGREIALSDGEFAIASVIAMNRLAPTREELCDQIWPDRDPESSARLLKVYIHRIRGKFGTNRVIDTHGGGYRLGREVRVDVHVLDALTRAHTKRAARLTAIELLDAERAFTGVAERRYRRIACIEAYTELERRLIATGIELGRILVHDALLRDDPAHAVHIAENLATLDPYDDVAAELLIRAQMGLGRHDAASRYFRTFCRTLHEELALPPPPHLARLFAQ